MGTKNGSEEEDVDVVALARATAQQARRAVRQERAEERVAHEEPADDGIRRRSIVAGVPQAVVDRAIEEMIRRGVRIDLRRIKKLSTGRFEVDMS